MEVPVVGVTAQPKTKDLAATLAERGLERTPTLFVDTEVRCVGLYREAGVLRSLRFAFRVGSGCGSSFRSAKRRAFLIPVVAVWWHLRYLRTCT